MRPRIINLDAMAMHKKTTPCPGELGVAVATFEEVGPGPFGLGYETSARLAASGDASWVSGVPNRIGPHAPGHTSPGPIVGPRLNAVDVRGQLSGWP